MGPLYGSTEEYTRPGNIILLPKPAVYDYFDKYILMCEMYDVDSDEMVDLILNFFPFDNSVQVVNPKKGKNLLRRTQVPQFTLNMLKIGNTVNVFSKLLLIRDCAPLTTRTLYRNYQRTFAMIKPCRPTEYARVISYITMKGFTIVQMRSGRISRDLALKLYRNLGESSALPTIIHYIMSGEVVGMELEAPDAVAYWRDCLGATDPKQAAPGTLRNRYGLNTLQNVAHGCNTLEEAATIIKLFFGYEKGQYVVPFAATLKDCTCCIIKPHAILDGHLGEIMEQIVLTQKLCITSMAMFSMRLFHAKEFYEVYKNVLPEYEEMCLHLTEGKFVAMEVKSINPNVNVVEELRKLCGPRDPELCRQLYPDTSRALYGKDIVHNAVHCTDLEEDGEAEVEYLFKLLANADELHK